MNKEQKAILLRKILPKAIILFIIVAIGLIFIVMKYKAKKADEKISTFMESSGFGETVLITYGMYDSILIDSLVIKYPLEYKVESQFGSSVGGYTLKSNSGDLLTIEYLPKTNIEPKCTSIDEAIEALSREVGKILNVQESAYSDISIRKIGQFSAHIKTLEHDANKMSIYGIESTNLYIVFRSYKNLLLEGVIKNIYIY